MKKITAGPSSSVWTKDRRWFACIALIIRIDEEHRQLVQIQRDFTSEQAAMQWRRTFMELLRDVSLEIEM